MKKPIVGLIFSLAILAGVLGLGFYLLPLNDRWRLIAAVPGPVRRTGRIVIRLARDLPYLPYQFKQHSLPVYDLRIDRADLAFLGSNIPDANANLLTDEFKVPVPVTLIHEGQSYEGKIRYRGGSKVHWLWPKKSYRINFKKSQLFHGEEEIDLIIPYDRQYVVEQFQMYRARKLGLIVPNTRFVAVTVNGLRPAVYWETELPGKPMLERQGLLGDANFYVSEDVEVGSVYDSVIPWKKMTADPHFSSLDRSDLTALLNLLNTASTEEFNRQIFSLLDQKNFYSWSVHTLLAKSNHQDWAHNMRLYFDPSLGKFRILPWDVGVLYNYQDIPGHELFEQSWNRLSNRILANPVFMAERNQRLWNYVREEKNLQTDLAEYDRLFDEVRVALYQDKIRRFDNLYIDREVARFRRVLEDQFYFLRGLFTDVEAEISVDKKDNGALFFNVKTKSLAPLILESYELRGGDGQNARFDLTHEIKPSIRQIDVPRPDGTGPDKPDFKGYELIQNRDEFELTSGKIKEIKQIVVYLRNEFTGELLTLVN